MHTEYTTPSRKLADYFLEDQLDLNPPPDR